MSAEDYTLKVRLIINLYDNLASGVLRWFSATKGRYTSKPFKLDSHVPTLVVELPTKQLETY